MIIVNHLCCGATRTVERVQPSSALLRWLVDYITDGENPDGRIARACVNMVDIPEQSSIDHPVRLHNRPLLYSSVGQVSLESNAG